MQQVTDLTAVLGLIEELKASLPGNDRHFTILRGNLEYLTSVLKESQEALSGEYPLFAAFNRDLSAFAQRCLQEMLQNCQKASQAASKDIKTLLEIERADARKLVPSRVLAGQLGISDQQLRREIYLARQRLNKPKSNQMCGDSEIELEESESRNSINITETSTAKSTNDSWIMQAIDSIPTCASPVRPEEEVDDDDDWLDVEAWLKREMFA